jgi:choline dehydrogenase-like flavoprotein
LALLLFVLLWVPGLANAADTNSDIVIIGAGPSGLYTAYSLNNLGFNVLVLEATYRRGGRTYPSHHLDPTFWKNGVAVSEFAAETVESTQNNFLQDDIHATFPGRLVPCESGATVFEATWDSNNATIPYPSDAPPEVYDYWDFYDHTFSKGAANHVAGRTVLEDLALGGKHGTRRGIKQSDRDFHLHLQTGATYQARLDDLEIRSVSRAGAVRPYGGGCWCFSDKDYLSSLNELYFDEIVHLVS